MICLKLVHMFSDFKALMRVMLPFFYTGIKKTFVACR